MRWFKNLIASLKQIKRDYDAAHPPLHNAASEGEAARVGRLLAAGADVHARDAHGLTALHWAVLGSGDAKVAELLLRHGADPNAPDRNGDTPLHDAAASGGVPLVSLLLERGANPTLRNAKGQTPVAVALDETGATARKLLLLPDCRRAVAELLRERGAT